MSLPLQGLTILIIDDHRDTVETLTKSLESAGALAVGAESAVTGLAAIGQRCCDAVLIHLHMPGQDGRWFVRQLRSVGRRVPVFAMSGRQQPADRDFAGEFVKPVDLDALVARLSQVPRRAS